MLACAGVQSICKSGQSQQLLLVQGNITLVLNGSTVQAAHSHRLAPGSSCRSHHSNPEFHRIRNFV